MTHVRLSLGRQGEELAAQLLKRKRHKILARNLKTTIGEIDLLTEHKRTIVLVEVKTKRGRLFGLPQEMVHRHKQMKLRQLARWLEARFPGRRLRVDVIGIDLADEDHPDITHLENVLGDS